MGITWTGKQNLTNGTLFRNPERSQQSHLRVLLMLSPLRKQRINHSLSQLHYKVCHNYRGERGGGGSNVWSWLRLEKGRYIFCRLAERLPWQTRCDSADWTLGRRRPSVQSALYFSGFACRHPPGLCNISLWYSDIARAWAAITI